MPIRVQWTTSVIYATSVALAFGLENSAKMRLETFLDRLHAWAVRSRWLVLLTAGTRVLLVLAFLPSGFVKVMGHRFTTLPTTDPVGYFFDAFFKAELFYRFVGVGQLIAALLLLHPSTSALG